MEQVVLLDDTGHAIGVEDKATVHHRDTPLHLAFSSYVFSSSGQLLVTRRSGAKKTWPGVWTNSCCGHPSPGEPLAEAVRRRLDDELGIPAYDVLPVLPSFRYRAVMPDGTVENEICPVFRATYTGEVRPDPAEVDAYEWVDWTAFASAVLDGAREVSPWCRLQVAELLPLGAPSTWPTADPSDLPPFD